MGLILLQCVPVFVRLALQAFYLAHVIRNTAAPDTLRVILGVGVFLLPFIAMSVYYYAYVWRDDPPDWALQKRADTA